MNILNIATYRFVRLEQLAALRDSLLELCSSEKLRGTILLAPEGINLFLAGTASGVARLREALEADPLLRGMDVKESWSREMPFKRLKVKIKKEIIAFGVPGIDPARAPAQPLSAATLKSWLDQQRAVRLVDTRNAFEVAHGTFEGAIHLGNDSFRGFAEVAVDLPLTDPDTPVVTFCTGGIRCEKAAPLLRALGHRNVYQLEGGILRYLESAGSAHFRGNCFVFDERLSLDAELLPQNIEQL
ncbi:MAG: rhodanese-like domain-containing protein [Betaproteobacteria bacterium]